MPVIQFGSIDARMLLTKLSPMEFISSIVQDPRYPILRVLKKYYTNTSVKEIKSVLTGDRSMPTDTQGVIQQLGKYDTIDWTFGTIKFGIKYEFGELEENDLQQSGAWLEIFNSMGEDSVNEFFELIGKRLSGLSTGVVNYYDETGAFMGQESIKVQDGEDFVVTGGRISGNWYQNVDGNATTTKVDVSPNYNTAPLSQASFLAGDKMLHKHRKPSKTGNAGTLLTHRKKYLLVHPSMVTEAKTLLDPNMYRDNNYAAMKPLLGQYEIIVVQFTNDKMWMQVSDAHTVGICAFIGKTHDNREIYPTIRKGREVNDETGASTWYKTSQSGLGAMTSTGVVIHDPA